MDKFIGTFFALLIMSTIGFTGLLAREGKGMSTNIKNNVLASYSHENATQVSRAPALERR